MRTLPLAVLILLASAGIAPAQTKSTGPLDLEPSRGPLPSGRYRRGRSRRTRPRRYVSSNATAPTACCATSSPAPRDGLTSTAT